MALWTLTYDGTTKSFADWGLRDLRRSQVSQSVGSVTFTQSGATYDGTPLFAIDSIITISKDGVPWHVGPVIVTPREGGAKSEKMGYEVADPWWYLEQLPFEQLIVTGLLGTPTNTTRIALFASVAGGITIKLTVQQMIQVVISYAAAAGAPIQAAFAGSFGISPPIVDMRDPTCAEVIRQILRWLPDVTCGWDYATTPPTLTFATRAGATVRQIDLADHASVNLINITPRDDLRRERVMIAYEITSTDDDGTHVSQLLDVAGTGSPFRTLKATLQLSGPQTTLQKQYIETEPVNEDSATWWQRHVPTLLAATDLSISAGSIMPEEDGADTFNAAIINGQVPGWMDDPDNPASGNMRISALASYKVATADGGVVEFVDDPVSVTMNCTYLATGTYTTVASYTAGESVPTGLAASLLNALGALQYETSLKIKRRECDFVTKPGEVLNLLNGATGWSTARMQVQRVDEVISSGETTIHCGPAKHLSPQDIIEMLRTFRSRQPVYNLDERATGIKGADAEVRGGRGGANENGNASAAGWQRVVARTDAATMTLDATKGVRLEDAEGNFIDHQIDNGRSLYDEAGVTTEIKAGRIAVLDEAGKGVTITPTGIVVTDGTNTNSWTLNQLLMAGSGSSTTITNEEVAVADSGGSSTLGAGSMTVESSGGASTYISGAQAILTEAGGSSNTISGTQMEIEADGATGTYGAGSMSQVSGSNSVEIDTGAITINQGDDNTQITAEGGVKHTASGGYAQMNGYAGVDLNIDGGTVVIKPQADKAVELRPTDFCEEDDAGEPVTAHALVLRSLPELTP